MGSAAVLTVLSTTYLGLPVCALFVLWQGVLLGGFIAALTLRYGIKGIILAAISLFPQYLIYIPAFMGLIFVCESVNRKIYFQKYPENTLNKKSKLADLTKIPAAFSAIFIGSIFESFINPRLLASFLKFF
jgi:phosphate/sulfate permease